MSIMEQVIRCASNKFQAESKNMNAHNEQFGDRRTRATEPEKTRLTALFIDFDNIYISLLGRDRFAATHFATNPIAWTSALLEGVLSTSAIDVAGNPPRRRMIIARVYGNPVMKTRDRSSFAFVRSHFMHAGYEVVDCPPLTNQLKNGSDIRMVLDMRDLIDHNPQIDEFVIMSGDSDFVPILLRLRAHNRRTMIFGARQTARSYTSLADEIITEEALVSFLHMSAGKPAPRLPGSSASAIPTDPLAEARREIIEEVTRIVEGSDKPVPMELLATSVRNAVGLKRTIDTRWAGHGQFSLLLAQALSEEFELSEKPPFMVWHKKLHKQSKTPSPAKTLSPAPAPPPSTGEENSQKNDDPENDSRKAEETGDDTGKKMAGGSAIDQIVNMTGIPALSARYYQHLFQLLSKEIGENGFVFNETANNAAKRGARMNLPVDPEHVQAVLHRIRRHGHWFSQQDSALVLAGEFRDSVVSECLETGMELSDHQLKLINDWFIPANDDGQEEADAKVATIAAS